MNRFAVYLILLALAFVGGSFYGCSTERTAGDLRIAELERTIVARETAAKEKGVEEERQQSAVTLAAAVKAAQGQERIVTRTLTTVQEVPRYVTVAQDARGCVTYGFVRVLDAAAQGLDPASLGLPAGKSDDDCTPLPPSDVARNIAGNYGIGLQNAGQLNDLIAYERQRIAAAAE